MLRLMLLLLLLVGLLLLELMMALLGLMLLSVLPLRRLVELGLAHAGRVRAVLLLVRCVLLSKLVLLLLHLMLLVMVLLLLLLLIRITNLLAGRAATSAGIHVPLTRIALAGRERALVCHDDRNMGCQRANPSGRLCWDVALSLSLVASSLWLHRQRSRPRRDGDGDDARGRRRQGGPWGVFASLIAASEK